ncbi:hypothetical protein BO70DRAFT_377623 [Aspergillus heteromorphus CBS 117.55]|uniref:Serine hydrolase domain-containing protein n=1 Tax=Aspergillus heteromorphus CBS 117.55 TaxID=1448321 RepID=A0A317WTT0_9EURO|nr:uncharacterized protein BO70DRAFT_377623 [Aspergillus heteromorphus CBS 117.55]PWY89221.1 hypothetical protein BO70DRAFT_377623 [Aspergillus heteromorphus CBS 117.55]
MESARTTSQKSKKFRILMLHGYAQSARVFRIKMRLLMEQITQSITPTLSEEYPGGIEFLFPDGPINLHAPGTSPSPEHSENQAWWLNLDDTSRYVFLNETLHYLIDFLHGEPIHGAIGFSQGGALAVMLTSIFEAATDPNPYRIQSMEDQGLPAKTLLARLPGQQPLQFVLSFCGFKGTMNYYSSLYSTMLKTPSFHAIGAFDTMVAAEKSKLLVNSFVAPEVLHYFGGHFIPRDRESLRTIMGFVQRTCADGVRKCGGRQQVGEEGVLSGSSCASVPAPYRAAKMFLIRRRPTVQMCRARRVIG